MFVTDRIDITTEREYTDEGFLIVPARVSRSGIQQYKAFEMGLTDIDPNKIVKVYRPEKEVFTKQSLSSFSNKPITDGHPPELVNAKNSKKYSVGHVGPEVTRDGDFVKTTLHIIDAETITKIENGKVELSNGYTADIEWKKGFAPNGEQYDAIQSNIKGNHIAIVDQGRAGRSCKVADHLPETGEETKMAKITIDGVDFEMSEQAIQAVGKLQQRCTDAEEATATEAEKLKKKEDEEEEAKKEAAKTTDSLQGKLDDAVAKVPTADALDKMIDTRMSVISSALKVMPNLDWKGKDAAAIRKEVVAAKCENVQIDSASEDYITARFDTLADAAGATGQTHLDTLFTQQIQKDADGKEVDNRPESVIARDAMMEQSRNAWKKGDTK